MRDYHEQISRTVSAAHGLAGWLHGRYSSDDEKDERWRRALDTDMTKEEAEAFFGAVKHPKTTEELLATADYVIWTGYRDAVRLQRFNPVWSTLGDVVDYGRQLSRARGAAILHCLRAFRRAFREFERAELECAARSRSK